MNENVKPLCPSCGHACEEGSRFCNICGCRLHDENRSILSLKWIILSMIALVVFQFLVLMIVYYLVHVISGPEAFMKYLMVISYIAIPAAIFAGSFLFVYIFTRCQAADVAAGIAIFVLLSSLFNFIFLDSFSFSGLVWIPVVALLGYSGAWTAKKLRGFPASPKNAELRK